MERIPIAMVGTGGMARRQVAGLAALAGTDHGNVTLAAVYGRDRAKAEALADEAAALLGRRPRAFTDLGAMAAALPEIAGVTIVTGTGSHRAVATACLAAGFHVMIEKPLALTVRGCNQIIELARERGKILSIAENYRRDPINRLAQALIAAGAIGTPRVMHESRIGGGSELFITPWRHQKHSGTVVLDTGVHNADILQYYMGPAHSVYGEGHIYERYRFPVGAATTRAGFANWTEFYARGTGTESGVVEATGEDALFAYIRFASGAIGHWTFNYAAHCPQEYRRVVYGSTGTITCPGDRNGRPIRLDFDGGRAVEDGAILDYAPEYRLEPLAAQLFGGERPWRYDFPYAAVDAKLLALELHEFGRCIATGAAPEVDGLVARRDVALVNAAFESGILGRAVTLAEIESSAVDTYQREIDLHEGLIASV
jgi:predicted dehydrogenase